MISKDFISSFYKCEDYFFRSLSAECLDFEDMGTAYCTQGQSPFLNPLFFKKNPKDLLKKILEKSQEFYKAHRCPWSVVMPEKIAFLHEKTLYDFSFHFSQKSVAMGAPLQKDTLFESQISSIIKYQDPPLEEWISPLVDAFGTTLKLSLSYVKAHERALEKNKDFFHLSAYEGKKAVCSLTLSLHGEGACLNDVGTLPSFQRKGFASHLISKALSEALKLGETQCFLESSEAGLALYKKFGFTSLFKNNIYLKDPK